MSQPTGTPQIVSDWAPADPSTNHLEVALTDRMIHNKAGNGQQQLVELRNSADPGRVIYVTPGEIRSFAQATQDRTSPLGKILAEASH